MAHPARLTLARLDTPLEALEAQALGTRAPWGVKRDDLTGSHLSGNKVRKLEFLLAEAVEAGATHVLTTGGVQSNHCRATALAAASLGMRPVLLLRTPDGTPTTLPSPPSGNVLLDHVAGAELVTISPEGYRSRDAHLARLSEQVRSAGGVPYVVPEGGSNALGSWGYVLAAEELLRAADAQYGAPPTSVVVATGSGGTVAGLALGFARAGARVPVISVPVCDDGPTFAARVSGIVEDALARWAHSHGLRRPPADAVQYVEGAQGQGYALSTDDELRFLVDVARRAGLVLDPVYTGKAFRCALARQADDPDAFGPRPVFVHTGGVFGLAPAGEALARVSGVTTRAAAPHGLVGGAP